MSDIKHYDPTDWYWKIDGNPNVYSSSRRIFCAMDDPLCEAFLASGGYLTLIASEAELSDVLSAQYPAGLPVDLAAYTARTRWALETGGISFEDLPVSTTRESQGLIHGAFSLASAELISVFEFKTETGFVTLSAPQIIALGKAVADHVQACFAWEKKILSEILSGAITSEAEIDADASAFLVPAN